MQIIRALAPPTRRAARQSSVGPARLRACPWHEGRGVHARHEGRGVHVEGAWPQLARRFPAGQVTCSAAGKNSYPGKLVHSNILTADQSDRCHTRRLSQSRLSTQNKVAFRPPFHPSMAYHSTEIVSANTAMNPHGSAATQAKPPAFCFPIYYHLAHCLVRQRNETTRAVR